MKSRLRAPLGLCFNALLAKVLHENQQGESTRPSETNYDAGQLYADPGLWTFRYGIDIYSLRLVQDNEVAGFIGFELMQTSGSLIEDKRVGRILYWDANGQISFETFGGVIPIVVIEALIAEAKRLIKR